MALVLVASTNLNARVRLESPALEVHGCRAEDIADRLSRQPFDALVVDLDEGGQVALEQVEQARSAGSLPERVLGFYSHVDEATGLRAQAAGINALPRSRFWRDVPTLLT